jgi:signal transduction histidine kinase
VSPPDSDAEAARWAELAQLAELGLLSASLFHEIRQPLFVLKGLVDLALSRRLGLQEEELRLILQELRHVEALVEHYGTLQSAPIAPEPLDLDTAVRAAVDAMAPRARQRGVDLQFRPGGGGVVVARGVAVRQVVVNLVANAIDAAVHGGRTVEVATRVDGGGPEVLVTDTGLGVDPTVRDRLFAPFVTTKPPGAGTGLGLFITRRLVAEFGGGIELVPGAGRGTLARVRFGGGAVRDGAG